MNPTKPTQEFHEKSGASLRPRLQHQLVAAVVSRLQPLQCPAEWQRPARQIAAWGQRTTGWGVEELNFMYNTYKHRYDMTRLLENGH